MIQLIGTLAILGFVPDNHVKLLSCLLWWIFTHRNLTRAEAVLGVVGCAIFIPMDAMAVARGVFAFSQPDALGLPVWEFAVWAFWLIHGTRMVGPTPARSTWKAWALLVPFAAAFVLFPDPIVLSICSSMVLLVAFAFFHDRQDFAYAGYFAIVGAAVECVGVNRGLWGYSGAFPWGIPPSALTMWAGIGLFTRRAVMPAIVTHVPSAWISLGARARLAEPG